MDSLNPVADTGFVVAITNRRDTRHADCLPVYQRFSRIYLPQTVLSESAFLIRRDAGSSVVIQFLRSLVKSRFELMAITEDDITQSANILDKYADSRIDFVDATVIAMAERLNCATILTLDRRDFTLYKPETHDAFAILP